MTAVWDGDNQTVNNVCGTGLPLGVPIEGQSHRGSLRPQKEGSPRRP